jgi:starch synthase
MRVLFATAEAAPLAKVGGLADVAAGLPAALRGLGIDVRVVMPRYSSIDPKQHHLRRVEVELDVPGRHGASLRCVLWRAAPAGEDTPYGPQPPGGADSAGRSAPPARLAREARTPIYLIEENEHLTRRQVYGEDDDLERFTIFCRAALAAAEAIDFRPDVVHANDWHTAILPAWLKLGRGGSGFLADTASVLTIHNLGFQGSFDEGFRDEWSFVPAAAVARTVSGVGLWSTMALGIHSADIVTTVSPTYAKEILTPQRGEGLDPLLRTRRDSLFGVLNGIDVSVFDPRSDPAISPNYGPASLERKAEAKAALQRECGLPERAATPLIGMVSRLTSQKGIGLVIRAIAQLLAERDFQLVVLGVGEEHLHRSIRGLARKHPRRIVVYLKFDAQPAQRIYAGADLFLMPSRFEPCGLGQLIALRYGTVPVVRATGGLRDTIEDWVPSSGTGNGFEFEPYRVQALLGALRRALSVYEDESAWRRLQLNGMRTDVSWEQPARRYAELYELALHAG